MRIPTRVKQNAKAPIVQTAPSTSPLMTRAAIWVWTFPLQGAGLFTVVIVSDEPTRGIELFVHRCALFCRHLADIPTLLDLYAPLRTAMLQSDASSTAVGDGHVGAAPCTAAAWLS